MDQDDPWHAGRPRLWPHLIVLDGDQLLLPQRDSPQFSAHVYCIQTAERIKMALGVEVGLGTGHIVLDGEPAPLPQNGGRAPPIFGPFLLLPNCWMNQDGTGHEGGALVQATLC